MDKLLIWVSGNKNEPSRRYRIDCFLKKYENNYEIIYFDNVSIKSAILNGSFFYYIFKMSIVKCIFLQRRLLPIWLIKILIFFNKKIIFDIDDGIQVYEIYKKYNFENFGKLINTIIVGNKNLYNFWSSINHKVSIVETGVEYSKYRLRSFNKEKINFLWVGSSSNFNNLNVFLDIFNNSILNDLELTIISDKIPTNLNDCKHSIKFEYWTSETDNFIVNSDTSFIGVMPLSIDDQQSKFKCSFKMLQYMNWSLPVLVTAYGMNLEILKMNNIGFELTSVENFNKSITDLINNPDLYNLMAINGNNLINSNFSHDIIFNKYIKIINDELSNL